MEGFQIQTTESSELRVVVELSDRTASLEDLENVEVESRSGRLVQICAPISKIKKISGREDVEYIRSPLYAHAPVESEGVGVIRADNLHGEGITGEGVKVAVIDAGFEGYSTNPEVPPGSVMEAKSFRADGDVGAGEVHGTACAEVILDVAPDAKLYLLNFGTGLEFADAVNYAISEGVDVISCSVNWFFGPHDGTGFLCDVVDNARDRGIFFAQSAGNYAKRHYEGGFRDADDDNWHEFSADPRDEFLNLGILPAYSEIKLHLSWDDWPESDQDYDLYLFKGTVSGWEIAASSENPQTGKQPPYELVVYTTSSLGRWGVAINKWDATRDVHLELYSPGTDLPEHNVESSSLGIPADAEGATAAGATYWESDDLEDFSSRGPTNDGRTKPDVAAPDGVSNYVYDSFFGTSASAPHLAGAAALLLDADPPLSPEKVQISLEATAKDLGPSGSDNLYGSGRIDVAGAYASTTSPTSARENWSLVSHSPDVLRYAVAVTGAGENVCIANSTYHGYPSYDSYFWKYNTISETWDPLSVPSGLLWKPGDPDSGVGSFKNGTSLAWDNGGYIYALFGGAYSNVDYPRHYFYRYNISEDRWEKLENTPNSKGQGAGDAITWVPGEAVGTETDWIYAIIGSKESEHGTTFCRYHINENEWKTLPYNPAWSGEGSDDGSSLVWAGGNYLYALQGEWNETNGDRNRGFARFDLLENTWNQLTPIPEGGGIGDGGSLARSGERPNSIFAIGGGSADENPGDNFYRYDVETGAWTELADLPYGVTDQNGPRLGHADGTIFCWRGYFNAENGDPDALWSYSLGTENVVVCVTEELSGGWNLFSPPLQPENSAAENVFAELASFPTIYGWKDGYEKVDPSDNLKVGRGYWIYVQEPENVTITGTPVENITLELDAGWNLAGLPSGVLPKTPSDIFAEVPTIYGWTETGYDSPGPEENFEPAEGYWIYMTGPENIPVS